MHILYLPIYHQKSTLHVGKYLYIIFYISAPMDPKRSYVFQSFRIKLPRRDVQILGSFQKTPPWIEEIHLWHVPGPLISGPLSTSLRLVP